MTRIVFVGDSITDMERTRNADFDVHSYGDGYVFFVEGELATKYPRQYALHNRGISGNMSVDIYARIKGECWNLQPDYMSFFFGINDLAADIKWNAGVEMPRYKRLYKMIIEDTLAAVKDVKIILVEPFALLGKETEKDYERYRQIREYAKAVKELAEEFDLPFVALQDKFDELAKVDGADFWIFDGIHPTVAGGKVIAEEWLKAFRKLEGIET